MDQKPADDPFLYAVIHTYTRAQAIEDGFLIEPDEALVKEAGIKVPVAIALEAWHDCVAWDEDDKPGLGQSEAGRLWDVLFMTRRAALAAGGVSDWFSVELVRVPREGPEQTAQPVTLHAVIDGGDDGKPVMTLMLPHER